MDIWRFVADDDPVAADQLLDRLDEASATLADNPRMGPQRPDIRPGLRYFVVAHYVILYRVIEDGVEIVRIVHGAARPPGPVLTAAPHSFDQARRTIRMASMVGSRHP